NTQLRGFGRFHFFRRHRVVHFRFSPPGAPSLFGRRKERWRKWSRRRPSPNPSQGEGKSASRVAGHPVTTALFVAICWLVVINTVYRYPGNTLIGLGILLAGIPAFYFWRWRNKHE